MTRQGKVGFPFRDSGWEVRFFPTIGVCGLPKLNAKRRKIFGTDCYHEAGGGGT